MRKALLSAVAVLLCLGAGWSETAQLPGQESPAQVAEDVDLLLVINQLGLTADQRAALVPTLQLAQQATAAFAQERTVATDRIREHLGDMIDALASGREPSPTRAEIVTRRLADLEAKRRAQGAALAQLWDDFRGAALTPDQAALVETPDRETERLYRLNQWQGARTALDFVMNVLGKARDLMPDEYGNARFQIAAQAAAGLLDPSAPGFSALESRVLALFDELHDVPAQQFEQDNAQIREHVSRVLQITPEMRVPEEGQYISYSAVMGVLTNPRTLKLLAGQDVPPLPADGLQPFLDTLDALRLAHGLQLDAGQLRGLATASAAVQATELSREAAKAGAAADNLETLQKVREAMLAGTVIPADLQTRFQAYLDKVHQQDATIAQRADDAIVQAVGVLYPKQQDLVQMPPTLASAPGAQQPGQPLEGPRLELKARLIALLEGSRGMDPVDFATAYEEDIAALLAAIAPPDSREYYRARWALRRLTGRAALVPDAEFPQAAEQLADDYLLAQGVPPEGALVGTPPISFEEFDRILRLPEAQDSWTRLAGSLPPRWTGG